MEDQVEVRRSQAGHRRCVHRHSIAAAAAAVEALPPLIRSMAARRRLA
jgi:hypothetical protein